MIRPRRGAGADPLLITGVLGAAVVLRQLRVLVAELAADGAAPDAGGDGDGDADPGDVVDVVLGLAALAAAVDHQVPDSPVWPGVVDPAEVRQPINLLVKELLR